MKHYPEKDLTETYKFVQAVKESCNQWIDNEKTAEQLKEEISNMCLDCFRVKNEDCDICLWSCKDQLFLNFEVIDAEMIRHNWDGDND